MKITCLLSPAFLLFPCFLFAQNWLPVVPGETYHYRLSDSAHITHSVRVDSIKTQGGDSVFYLNRVVKTYVIPDGIDTIWLPMYKQGQFLGQTMTKKADGRLIFEAQNYFFDTSIVVRPNASVGESWLAISDGNINAIVTSITEGQVLGATDSLKTIQFGNGATWVLSKNHGLVSIPDFNAGNSIATLSGLENQGIGDRLYRFKDFFEFNIGDVFQYSAYAEGFTGSTETYTKFTILEIQIASLDTFQYLVERSRKVVLTGLFNDISYYQDTAQIKFFHKDYKNAESYNGQIITPFSNQDRFSFATYLDEGIQLGNLSSVSDAPGTCSALSIPEDPNHLAFYIDDALDCGLGDNAGIYFYYEAYRPNLGRVGYSVSIIDYSYSEWLRGAIIQDDTIGSIKPDWFFTGTKEPKPAANALKIYPNPASDFAILEVNQPLTSAVAQIFSLEGILLRTLEINSLGNTTKLDLAGLPAGAYFLLLNAADEVWHGKFIKAN